MFGCDKFDVHIGINNHVPFISCVNEDGVVYRDNVNIVAINDPKERATCIVVEDNGRYADFYYNGCQEVFKVLTESGYEENSWENEDFGITPKCILENGIDSSLVNELIEIY